MQRCYSFEVWQGQAVTGGARPDLRLGQRRISVGNRRWLHMLSQERLGRVTYFHQTSRNKHAVCAQCDHKVDRVVRGQGGGIEEAIERSRRCFWLRWLKIEIHAKKYFWVFLSSECYDLPERLLSSLLSKTKATLRLIIQLSGFLFELTKVNNSNFPLCLFLRISKATRRVKPIEVSRMEAAFGRKSAGYITGENQE